MFTIQSAQIASDGTISTVFTITDPKGVPLDREGIVTPGAVSTSFVAAYIPANQSQYVAYTTRSASGAVVASTQQAAADSGGTYTRWLTANIGIHSLPRRLQVSRRQLLTQSAYTAIEISQSSIWARIMQARPSISFRMVLR